MTSTWPSRTVDVPAGLTRFLRRLKTWKVNDWGGDSATDMSVVEREEIQLAYADTASSAVAGTELHVIVLDIDHEAWLVPSSTPGHSHLYVSIPPVSTDAYFEFVDACAKIGFVEENYAKVSRKRGRTDVRLPWRRKSSSTVRFEDNGPFWSIGLDGKAMVPPDEVLEGSKPDFDDMLVAPILFVPPVPSPVSFPPPANLDGLLHPF